MKGGRGEACQGDGVLKVEMHFLPKYTSVRRVPRQRYNRETLEIQYKAATSTKCCRGRSSRRGSLQRRAGLAPLQTCSTWVGDITLGQSATTLSGGEAQRVKLALELSSATPAHALHPRRADDRLHSDIDLLRAFSIARDHGNTIVVIDTISNDQDGGLGDRPRPEAATAAAASSRWARPKTLPRPAKATPGAICAARSGRRDGGRHRELLLARFQPRWPPRPAQLVPGHLPQPPKAARSSSAPARPPRDGAAVEQSWPAAAPLDGLVVTRYQHGLLTNRIAVIEAGHPVPDEAGEKAAQEILKRTKALTRDDLLLVLLSGGGSSLLSLPAEGLGMDDLTATTRALLRSGAPIQAMNTVRKHLSAIQGGRVAARAVRPWSISFPTDGRRSHTYRVRSVRADPTTYPTRSKFWSASTCAPRA